MSEDRLDKQIKSKLKNHETNMDTASFWDELSPKIQKKKKDKRGLIWLFFIPMFLGLIALVYFNWDGASNERNTLTSGQSELDSNRLQESKGNLTHSIMADDELDLNEIAALKKDENELSITSENQNKHEEKNESFGHMNQTKDKELKSKNTNNENSVNSLNTTQRKSFQSVDLSSTRSKIATQQIKQNFTNNTNNTSNTNEKSNPLEIVQDNLITNSTKLLRSSFDIAALNFKPVPLDWNRDLQIPTQLFEEFEANKIISPSWNFGLSGFASYGQFQRQLESQSDTLGLALKAKRESNESSLESVGGGLVFEFEHRSGFYGTIGLNYTCLNERYRGIVISEDIESRSNIETGIEITPDSVFAYFSDAEVLVTYGIEQIRHNKTQFLDLPISLGYRRGLERFDISFELGTQINLLTFYNGTIANQSDEGYNLSNDDQYYFKKSTGLSLNADVVLGYNLNDKYRLWTGYSYLNRMSSVTNSNYYLQQYYQQNRLKLGLQIKW